MPKIVDPFFDGNRHLLPLPDAPLRDLARNGAAPREYRKAAVEILFHRKSPYVKHQDLREFVAELEIELDGIVFEHPAPSGPGPLSASMTTKNIFAAELPIGFTGFDSVQIMDKPDPPLEPEKEPDAT